MTTLWTLLGVVADAAKTIGWPLAILLGVIGFHVFMTNQTLEAHNEKTIALIESMRDNQDRQTAVLRQVQETRNERMIQFLRAICLNTAVYDKNLIKECGRI